MVQIDVSLLTTGTRTQVNPDPSSAHSDDSVYWVFHSFDPTVAEVEIAFDKASESYFFPRGNGPAFKSLRANLVGGSATIWGRAPHIGGAGQRPTKYTINAYDAAGNPIAAYYLDPTVVTEEP